MAGFSKVTKWSYFRLSSLPIRTIILYHMQHRFSIFLQRSSEVSSLIIDSNVDYHFIKCMIQCGFDVVGHVFHFCSDENNFTETLVVLLLNRHSSIRDITPGVIDNNGICRLRFLCRVCSAFISWIVSKCG